MKTLNQDEVGMVAGATGALIPVGAAVGAAIGVPVGAAAGAGAVLSVPVAGLILSDAGVLMMSQANGIDVSAGIDAVAAQTRTWVNQQVQTWGALPVQIVGLSGRALSGLQCAQARICRC